MITFELRMGRGRSGGYMVRDRVQWCLVVCCGVCVGVWRCVGSLLIWRAVVSSNP